MRHRAGHGVLPLRFAEHAGKNAVAGIGLPVSGKVLQMRGQGGQGRCGCQLLVRVGGGVGDPGLVLPGPDHDFRHDQPGLERRTLGEGKGPKGTQPRSRYRQRVLDLGLRHQLPPPLLRLRKPGGAGGGEAVGLTEPDEAFTAPDPAKLLIQNQILQQTYGGGKLTNGHSKGTQGGHSASTLLRGTPGGCPRGRGLRGSRHAGPGSAAPAIFETMIG